MSAVDDRIAFLRDRIAEDEAVAREAVDQAGSDWRSYFKQVLAVASPHEACPAEAETSEVAAHIARWDPARVLAEVEAKRRIVDECAHELARSAPKSNLNDFACTVLRNLGTAYAEHPDYRPEWRS